MITFKLCGHYSDRNALTIGMFSGTWLPGSRNTLNFQTCQVRMYEPSDQMAIIINFYDKNYC